MACCSMKNVDWLVDGPLIRCESEKMCNPSEGCCCCIAFNWPCCTGPAGTQWKIEERNGKRMFILPIKEPFPLFLCALPVFWIHVCFFLCVDKADGLVLIHDRDANTFAAELREKTAFGSTVHARRTQLTKAYVEDQPGSLLKFRQARYEE